MLPQSANPEVFITCQERHSTYLFPPEPKSSWHWYSMASIPQLHSSDWGLTVDTALPPADVLTPFSPKPPLQHQVPTTQGSVHPWLALSSDALTQTVMRQLFPQEGSFLISNTHKVCFNGVFAAVGATCDWMETWPNVPKKSDIIWQYFSTTTCKSPLKHFALLWGTSQLGTKIVDKTFTHHHTKVSCQRKWRKDLWCLSEAFIQSLRDGWE